MAEKTNGQALAFLGNNVQYKVEGNMLHLVVAIDPATLKSALPSKSSGKTRTVATTSGFTGVAGTPIKVSLNVSGPLT